MQGREGLVSSNYLIYQKAASLRAPKKRLGVCKRGYLDVNGAALVFFQVSFPSDMLLFQRQLQS